jgi:hypothetical protein
MVYVFHAPVWLWPIIIGGVFCLAFLAILFAVALWTEIKYWEPSPDVTLRDAINFSITREWGSETENLNGIGKALVAFHQGASDGKILVWGRPINGANVLVPIPREYWTTHHVDLNHLLDYSRTSERFGARGAIYFDIMVSRYNWSQSGIAR